jgi:hypothetical protein
MHVKLNKYLPAAQDKQLVADTHLAQGEIHGWQNLLLTPKLLG